MIHYGTSWNTNVNRAILNLLWYSVNFVTNNMIITHIFLPDVPQQLSTSESEVINKNRGERQLKKITVETFTTEVMEKGKYWRFRLCSALFI